MLKLFFYVLLVFLQSPVIQDINKDQVNSLINDKVTVNFENVGKIVINAKIIELKRVNEKY